MTATQPQPAHASIGRVRPSSGTGEDDLANIPHYYAAVPGLRSCARTGCGRTVDHPIHLRPGGTDPRLDDALRRTRERANRIAERRKSRKRPNGEAVSP